ncbi:unnamed protein product [Sphenostylis stenocarpa]|uniref:Uncharacterized protein n=1 Tax=Sphenostylis stenocarpa TaxID=92480 RepID=A0AA86SHS2_9FABA|nr:unnamed protein product [Sphenostylis stenocarpa]
MRAIEWIPCGCFCSTAKSLSLPRTVVTASLASEALSIIEEKKNELNLALLKSQEVMVNNSREFQPFMNTGGHTLQSVKIEEQKHKIGGKQSESLALGRKRLNRTYDSHMKFFGGVELAGGTSEAPPKQRHQLRNVPGLAIQNVETHLQSLFLLTMTTKSYDSNLTAGQNIFENWLFKLISNQKSVITDSLSDYEFLSSKWSPFPLLIVFRN